MADKKKVFSILITLPGKHGKHYGKYESYEEAYEAIDGPEFDWVPFGSTFEVKERNKRGGVKT